MISLLNRLMQCCTLLSLVFLPALAIAASIATPTAAPIPPTARLEVEFALPKIDTTVYARPYVAIWIENSQQKSVRTVQLWVGKDEWLKDLRSWWRKVGRYDRELVDAVTSATRPAGEYRFVWDGLDHAGNRVEQGDYTFYVEVVREHGGRNYLRQQIHLGEIGFSYLIAPTEETGDIRISYQIK